MVTRSLETDYFVVGAGAMGMAFTDALIDHADVHVTLVDRRHAAGGHWQDAYPFVQLHQASVFYGVASTVLGSGAMQLSGPEAGLQERARQSEIQAYYDDILRRRFLGSGRVTFLGGGEYHADGASHLVTSRVSGETVQVDVRRRVVAEQRMNGEAEAHHGQAAPVQRHQGAVGAHPGPVERQARALRSEFGGGITADEIVLGARRHAPSPVSRA